jgi:hypothetical protein
MGKPFKQKIAARAMNERRRKLELPARRAARHHGRARSVSES